MNRTPQWKLIDLTPWILLLAIITWGAVSWLDGGIVAQVASPERTNAERIHAMVAMFQAMEPWAPFAYITFTCVEVVVAPIPGLMLYAPGGLVFGPVTGGVLAIVGNTLGAGLSCWLARSFGDRWIQRMASDSGFSRFQTLIERRGFWILFLLRLNPLTSSDLLSYAAGMTRMPTWQVMCASGLGLAPLCLLQSWLSDSIFHRWPFLFWPLIISAMFYIVVVVAVISRILRQKPGIAPEVAD
ncbi:MAG: TVP38/TMEM64 family protein [Planctomycetota bacterium]